MKWSDITLAKFQQIEQVNNQDIPDIDKVLFSTCIVFDMTEYELDNSDPVKVVKLTTKVKKIFETPFNERHCTKIGKYFLNYDISKMTFGQYIELAFFLTNPLKNAQYILATISKQWLRKFATIDHRKKADYYLIQPIEPTMSALKMITEAFIEFNKEYKNLFGVDREVTGDVQQDEFNKRYGWIYSATQVADHEKINLDETFALPVRRAFNALAFLKAKGKYEAEQFKKMNKSIA